jgi:peptidoglycan/LPS O-acetylase OafA/YrhL
VPDKVEAAPVLGYRPGLDGARALAVLMVAGVHTHPRLVPGGSIGVDVFFVLSGFLITTLLVEELDTRGRIFLARFYGRRGLRLLPALAGLLVVVTVWAVFVAAPDTRHRALLEVLAAASYTRNFTWWSHVPGTLLGHTWSLALEEQFYLVWPLLLTLCLRPRRSGMRLARIFVIIFVVVAAFRLAHVAGPGLLFIQRFEALLLGAAVALVRRQYGQRWIGALANTWALRATVVGGTGLIALAAWDGADAFFSGGFTIAAICASLLIVGLVIVEQQGPARLFTTRPAVAFGRISYGFYLWHMPVLRWTDDRLVGRSAFIRIPVGLGAALIATLLSYRILELPALRLKNRLRAPEPVAVPT